MYNNRGVTMTSVINAVLVYCLLRFGLVFTAGFNLFGLAYVVVVGTGIVFLNAWMSKRYTGELLQGNLIMLIFNILSVGLLKNFIQRSSDIAFAASYFNQLIILAILWGLYVYIRHLPTQKQGWLAGIYLSAIAVSAAYTFYVAMNGDDNIIRNTAFGEYDPQFSLTYGGFDFIYGLVVVYVILLEVLVHGGRRLKKGAKLIIVLLMVLFAVTIIASSFSTAFALILVSTIFIAPKKLRTKLLLFGTMVFFVYVIPKPLTKFIESIPYMPELTSERINEIILSFSGQGTSAYLTDEGQRIDRITWSLKAFLAHPIVGVYGSGGTNRLGYHTEWIDQLARYGIVTAIFNTSFWVLTYQKMERSTSSGSLTNKCIKSAFIVYFILGFLNTISMVVTSAPLFMLCPFAESLFMHPDTEKDLATTQ